MIKRLGIFKKPCRLCGKKSAPVKDYESFKGGRVTVCNLCLPYAYDRGLIIRR